MSKLMWVLVRSKLDNLYVLPRPDWDKHNAHAERMGQTKAELVLESEDYDELRRFRDLTRDGD